MEILGKLLDFSRICLLTLILTIYKKSNTLVVVLFKNVFTSFCLNSKIKYVKIIKILTYKQFLIYSKERKQRKNVNAHHYGQ